MIVRFDATPDDHAYVYTRVLERARRTSPALRRSRWRQLLVTAAMGAVIFYVLTPGTTLVKAIAGVAGAAVATLLWIPTYRANTARAIRRLVNEHHPPGQLVPFSVELTDAGLVTSSPEGDSVTPWSHISDIEETERSIDFWTAQSELVAVQMRAFATPAETESFLAAAHRFHARATPIEAQGT